MKGKRPAPVRDADVRGNAGTADVRSTAGTAHARGDRTAARGGGAADGERRRTTRQPSRRAGRRGTDVPPRGRRTAAEQRRPRSALQTTPIPRLAENPVPPKTTRQAKARSKARKAKAPKVVRPPLRDRVLLRLASIELNPRTLAARVPFVVLVIGALGLGLATTLWLSTGSAERSYQLGTAREINQTLLQQKEALERDVLEAQAAPALAEAARGLGMIPSRDTAHLVQDPSGAWVVVGTPKPAEGVPPPPLNTPLPEERPAPPPPPALRVVEPRELTVRVPDPGAVPPAAEPHGAPGQPPALGPAEPPAAPLAAPVPPAVPADQLPPAVPADELPAPLDAVPPVEAPPADQPLAVPLEAGPPHLPAPGAAQPGPVPGTEQFGPVGTPAPGGPA